MPAALIGPLIGGASSIIGGLFGSKKATNTSTSTNTPSLTPNQQAASDMFLEMLRRRMKKPNKVLNSDRNAARGQINTTYDNLENSALARLSDRGYGESGKAGQVVGGLEMGRANSFQNAESDLMKQKQEEMMRLMQMAAGFGQPSGSTTTSTGTQTLPGTSIGSTIAGVGGNIGTAAWLQGLLGHGGGSSGSDSSDWAD